MTYQVGEKQLEVKRGSVGRELGCPRRGSAQSTPTGFALPVGLLGWHRWGGELPAFPGHGSRQTPRGLAWGVDELPAFKAVPEAKGYGIC